jgi:uncharacterized HhH-GPD family protein
MPTLYLATDPAADKLLATDPLALLIGMLLDQQISLEHAFSAPYHLQQRLGHDLDARELADYDTGSLIAIFSQRPALHRFPKAMAARVQELCRLVVDRYDGDAARVWTGAKSGAELAKRVGELPGFGKQKAQIFLALLGKQLGVQPDGWREVADMFGEEGVYRSVADITDADSLQEVRQFKKQQKAAK